VTWTLAVFRQCFQSLVDQSDVGLRDVQSKKAKSTGRTATDAVQKLQRLTDNVVVCLVILRPQVILPQHRTAIAKLHLCIIGLRTRTTARLPRLIAKALCIAWVFNEDQTTACKKVDQINNLLIFKKT